MWTCRMYLNRFSQTWSYSCIILLVDFWIFRFLLPFWLVPVKLAIDCAIKSQDFFFSCKIIINVPHRFNFSSRSLTLMTLTDYYSVYLFSCVCVCVFLCVWERERERERKKILYVYTTQVKIGKLFKYRKPWYFLKLIIRVSCKWDWNNILRFF
jgi:hypothetical protein